MHTWHQKPNCNSASQNAALTAESPSAALCLQLVDIGLLGVLFVGPLFLGGRHALGHLVFASFISLAVLSWCAHQLLTSRPQWTRSWAYLLGISATLLVAIQIVPLPPSWLAYLAPRNQGLLTLFSASSDASPNLGPWQTLSLTPSATKASLAMLVSYCLLFTVTVQRLQNLSDIRRVIQWIALSAIAMGGFGLLQYYTANGLFFWFYEVPFTSTYDVAKGSFTCKNHFAHFLVLGLGPLIAWCVLHIRQQREVPRRAAKLNTAKTACLVLGLVLITLGVLLSLSRGGLLVLAVASSFLALLYYFKGLASRGYLLGLAVLGLLAICALSTEGYNQVSSRVDDFSSASLEELDRNHGRRNIWAANWSAIRAGSWFGSGAGSHTAIYPVYLQESFEGVYTHAESGFLQIPTENGWLGAALLLTALILIGYWSWQALRNATLPEQTALAGAAVAGLVVSAVHSLFDFVWYIPACITLALLLAACLLRLAQIGIADNSPSHCVTEWSKPRWIIVSSLATLAVIWSLSTLLGPAGADPYWNRYLLIANHNKRQNLYQLQAGTAAETGENDKIQRLEAMIYQLQKTLSLDRESADAHLQMTMRYLQLFNAIQLRSNNVMSVEQIREASMASGFTSAKQLQQWLRRAIGDHGKLLYRARYHARQALQLSPLTARAYLYLAKLCFLDGQNPEQVAAYIKQSLCVSPRDGGIMYQVGKEWFAAGHVEEAIALWQASYQKPGRHQLQIIRFLANNVSVEAFLETFHPDWQTLPGVWQYFSQSSGPEQLDSLVQYAKDAAQAECQTRDHESAAKVLHKLATMQADRQQFDAALTTL
ncbi:MAG: O-antigen ligase family protein, partial [Pirellulales bacterium]|nr:O-antigen ligase family protein [Pirellulales bacterium]